MKKHIVSIFAVFFAALFSSSFAQQTDKYDDPVRYPRSEPVDLLSMVKEIKQKATEKQETITLAKTTIVGIPTPEQLVLSCIRVSAGHDEVSHEFVTSLGRSRVCFIADRKQQILRMEFRVDKTLIGSVELLRGPLPTGFQSPDGSTIYDIDVHAWKEAFLRSYTPVIFTEPSF